MLNHAMVFTVIVARPDAAEPFAVRETLGEELGKLAASNHDESASPIGRERRGPAPHRLGSRSFTRLVCLAFSTTRHRGITMAKFQSKKK